MNASSPYAEAQTFLEMSWLKSVGDRAPAILFVCPRCGAAVAEEWTGAVTSDTNRVQHVEWHEGQS